MGREDPGRAGGRGELQTDDLRGEGVDGARGPAVRVRCVGRVVVVAFGGAVAEGAVGEVAFDTGAGCAGGVVQVPAPGGADQVESARGLARREVSFDLEGLREADDVVGEFGGDGSDGAPVCG